MTTELKKQIQSALNNFINGNLLDNTKALLKILGYESERTFQLSPNNYKGFTEYFENQSVKFDKDKARTKEWQTIDIIFQLTEDDIKKNYNLFQIKRVDNTIIESYLFFALSLSGDKYTRSDLVRITREINKLTPMPSMILFLYNNYLTVSVIDRRLHKRESTKDVLEKVTLIKDIYITKPHRAHIEILYDLSLQNLIYKYSVSNFVELHNAWRKTLDTSELNKKFYREIANWYFWAVQNVEFPDDAEKDRDIRNAISVIRLITRLIFVWFIKEKGLIPDELFNQSKLKQTLAYTDKNKSTYYKAILQNLFFATLNTEMGKSQFRSKAKEQGNRDQHYMIHNLFRHADYFINQQDAFKAYFTRIPFLNGGLFECLDKRDEVTGKPIRIDGFSDRKDNVLKAPDYLFFSAEQSIDLNEIYGTRSKSYKVKGLIDILDSYKFTIDENTPVEEEIALDPACGSGAFPMGILHKLVYILSKLDPDNSKWRELQKQKAIKETEEAYRIGDKEERTKRLLDINEVFENNASDYGRKLYLIENCIYGVDIQPIAVQIAKLRFFISLIVDQHVDPKNENLGVRPLPNLETKFVAANTLIGIEKPAQLLLRNPEIDRKEKELKEARERHFTARTPQTKEKYRKEDERLRAEISELLKKDGFPRETTEKLAKWNPYDQNASADFFDPEWMFGVTEGFDVVMGNPPYIKKYTYREAFDGVRESPYYQGKMDIWYLFACLSLDMLRKGSGILTFIATNNWVTNAGASKMRNKVIKNAQMLKMLDFGTPVQ